MISGMPAARDEFWPNPTGDAMKEFAGSHKHWSCSACGQIIWSDCLAKMGE
jgi:hypothetical protein